MIDGNGKLEAIANNAMLRLASQILILAVVPYLAWITSSVNTNSAAIAVLVEREAGLDATMNMKVFDRYHASDATRDFALRDQRIDEILRRLEKLEAKQ